MIEQKTTRGMLKRRWVCTIWCAQCVYPIRFRLNSVSHQPLQAIYLRKAKKNRQNITSCARIVQKVYFENENENKYENVSDLINAKCCVLRRAAAMASAHTQDGVRVHVPIKTLEKSKNKLLICCPYEINSRNKYFLPFQLSIDCKRKWIDALPIGLRTCWSQHRMEWNDSLKVILLLSERQRWTHRPKIWWLKRNTTKKRRLSGD